jgi:uridine kinase
VLYLIGGPARCGKSTLATQVRRRIDGQVLSGDAFVHALRDNLRSEWVPDIFDHEVADIVAMSSDDASIDRLRRRDETMWQFYAAYLRGAAAKTPHDDVLIEGNIWPDFLELLSLPHKAVFLVDTSPAQYERLVAIRNGTSDNNWMKDFSDKKMIEWAAFNARRSERYVALCKVNDRRYFDIAEHGVERAEQLALEYLVQ